MRSEIEVRAKRFELQTELKNKSWVLTRSGRDEIEAQIRLCDWILQEAAAPHSRNSSNKSQNSK